MTQRYMFDAMRVNAGTLVKLNPAMVAIYLTGSPDIRWTPVEVAFFPRAKFVRIDQGGPTSPQYEANVCDVEPNAWTVEKAQSDFLPKCTAPVPTLYVNRTTLKSVTADCAIWLAAPGLTDAEAIALAATDKRIVAVQNVWNDSYDKSIITDPYWPEKAPVAPAPVVQPDGLQAGWNFCSKCGCLIHVPESRHLSCAAGGQHSPNSHNYILYWNDHT